MKYIKKFESAEEGWVINIEKLKNIICNEIHKKIRTKITT